MITKLSLASLAITGAAAFLLPPNTAIASLAIPNTLQDPFSIKLFAPCHSCPYAQHTGRNGLVWTRGVDSSLYVDVSVNNKLDTLELNGVQIYPPPTAAELQLDPVTPSIAQVLPSTSLKEVQSNPQQYLEHALRVTSWGMQTTTLHSVKETGEEIIKIQIAIDSLERQHINMPNIVITALKNKASQLMILNVELQRPSLGQQCHGMPLMCRLRQMFANSINAMRHKLKLKSCHKPLPPHHISAAEQHKADEVAKPHPHHHHHHHHHHAHKAHHLIHKIARLLLTVAIPLMLGILAGMLTYTFGMLLGTFIGFLWTRFRSNREDYQPIALPEEDVTPRTSFEERKYYDDEHDLENLPMYVQVEANEAGSRV